MMLIACRQVVIVDLLAFIVTHCRRSAVLKDVSLVCEHGNLVSFTDYYNS